MVNRRSITALSTAVALAFSVALVAQKKDDKKQSDAQKKEIQDVVRFVDGVAAGQPAPNDLGLAWVHEDFLKATGNKQYIPFTVTYDPSKATGQTVSLYWRVVSKDAAAAAPAAAPAGEGREERRQESAGPALRLRGPEHHPRDGRPDRAREDQPLVHRRRRDLRRLRRGQGSRPRSRRTPRRRRCR